MSTLSRVVYGPDGRVGSFFPLEKMCHAQGERLSQEKYRGHSMDGTRVTRSAQYTHRTHGISRAAHLNKRKKKSVSATRLFKGQFLSFGEPCDVRADISRQQIRKCTYPSMKTRFASKSHVRNSKASHGDRGCGNPNPGDVAETRRLPYPRLRPKKLKKQ